MGGGQWPSIPEGVVALCGVVYFTAWSFSFYPQLILNFQRKRTEGLSADYVYLNPLGFLALTIWNWGMFFSPIARWQYGERHGGHAPQISVSDLAFSLHALIISLLWIVQVWYYAYRNRRRSERGEPDERERLIPSPADLARSRATSGSGRYAGSQAVEDGRTRFIPSPAELRKQRATKVEVTTPSLLAQLLIYGILIGGFISAVLVWAGKTLFLDWLYFASAVKLIISIFKYIPQVLLNWRIRSVEGFAIANVILDLIGSIFSFLQLVVSSIWIEEDPGGIIANPAKLGLAFLSFSFDVIFLLQKYVFFRNAKVPLVAEEDED